MNIRSFMGESFGEQSHKKTTNDQISSQNSTQHFASKPPSVVSKEAPSSTNNFAKMPATAMNQTVKSSNTVESSQMLDMSINSKTFTSAMPTVPVMQKTRNKEEAGLLKSQGGGG